MNIKLDRNVYSAQAFGTWLFIQLQDWALFIGSHKKRGVRFVWRWRAPFKKKPTLKFVKHDWRPTP